jgi:hypothetical protein
LVLTVLGLTVLWWRIYDLLAEGINDRYTATRLGLSLEGANAISVEFIIIIFNLIFLIFVIYKTNRSIHDWLDNVNLGYKN